MKFLPLVALVLALASPVSASFVYQSDDGRGNTNTGPSFDDTDFLWGNYYTARPDFGRITQVQVAYGRVDAGRPVSVLVYDDPDDDGDPRNAALVAVAEGTTAQPNANNAGSLDAFVSYDIAAEVEGGFLVAAHLSDVDGRFNSATGRPGDAPARRDRDTATGAGWLFFGPLGTGPLDLSAYPVAVNVGSPAVFGGLAGDNLVRAVAVPEPSSAVLVLFALAALTRRDCRGRSRGATRHTPL